MDITDISYVPDPMVADACNVFDLQQNHVFGSLFLVSRNPAFSQLFENILTQVQLIMEMHNSSSMTLSLITQRLMGRQRLEIIKHELDDLTLDSKWGKTCESFLNG